MKRLIVFLLAVLSTAIASAYVLQRASVHDPSIVWNPATQNYYVFGSHRAAAKTTDLMAWTQFTAPWQTATSANAANSAAFTTQQVTKVTIGGVERDFKNFNAHDWSAAIGSYGSTSWGSIDGNMWAPDVIYNQAMGKWCMYLSINGVRFNSSIILLTADNIEGPYRYQAPVVISGFNVTDALDYKLTDLELAIGEQATLPDRYAKGNSWGGYWPHCIDPCVFYDEGGNLWMTYGSWSNGIWMLQLDEQTGLRDYNVAEEYGNDSSRGINVSKDPYYGTKIAGGRGHSGEASYIEHIGQYYYLFVTYGGLVANGGYQMRVFRSENPDGPYTDSKGTNAILTTDPRNGANFGPGGLTLGENIFGAYGEWGYTTTGINSERSQGHNSILAAEDGRTYMVFHTRFQNRGEEHEIRVHQVFVNKEGWLCAAPFEYTGETATDADIASQQLVGSSDVAGSYQVLIHQYGLDHSNMALTKPVAVSLQADGTVSGAYSGTWSIDSGTSYVTITLDGNTYTGVMVWQTLEPTSDRVPAFTAMDSSTGVTLWGYKAETDWQYAQDFSSDEGLTIVGGGSFVSDETFGSAYQNGGGAQRSHYLLLPSDVLAHSAVTKALTISFWVSAENAGESASYLWAPIFTAYGAEPTANTNTWPMLACQYRGVLQLNCAGYTDYDDKQNAAGVNTLYHGDNDWLADKQWHYYTVVFENESATVYFDGVAKNEWPDASKNDSQGRATTQMGLFSNGGDLKYICLGGNQAWDWKDNDAAFKYARLLIQNKAVTPDEIIAQMQADKTSGISILKAGIESVSATYNLAGQRVGSGYKGVVIRNGRKFISR